jgi:hypothetical protein
VRLAGTKSAVLLAGRIRGRAVVDVNR